MSLRKIGGFHFVALSGLVILGVLSISAWLWLARVSDRVLNNLDQQIGQRLPAKDITFDPWQRRLTASDIQLEEQGIQFTAQQASLVLNYRHWWGPWLGENIESFSAVELDNASVTIDPALIATPLPSGLQGLSINRGTLAITGIDQPLSFDQLTLKKEEEGRIGIDLANRDGASWSFSGVYEVSKGLLDGEARLVKLPLSALVKADPVQALVTLNNELSASDHLGGTVSAILSLSWDKPGGLTLKGNVAGQRGQLSLPGMFARWQQWSLNNLQFHGHKPAQSTAELSVSGLDLTRTLTEEWLVQSVPTLPVFISSFAINDSRLELAGGHLPWIFANVNASLVADAISGKGKDVWTYQLSAALADVGDFQLSGQLSGFANDFAFQLSNARLAGPLQEYSFVAGYNMQGTEFDLSYNSQKLAGQLDISDWQAKKIANGSPVSSIQLLKALITDPSGIAVVPFAIKPGKSNAALPKRICRAVEQRLMAIADAPFDYLSRTTGHALEPVLYFEAGKATLTKRSKKNLEHLHKVLSRKPQLNALIAVGIPESGDWPELSRYELEDALLELYSATSSVAPSEVITLPPGVRSSLVEQMYLATRQHQKIPEVGEQSPEQRVQEAETWLLKNWPKRPAQLENLQKARYDYLKSEIGRCGMACGHIELQLSSGPDRQGSGPESILTLH